MVRATQVIHRLPQNRSLMIGFAAVFFVVALISGIVGFGGLAAAANVLAKIVFFVFLVLFVASLLIPVSSHPAPPSRHDDPPEWERPL